MLNKFYYRNIDLRNALEVREWEAKYKQQKIFVMIIPDTRKETDIQNEFFEKINLFFPHLPEKLLFAIPNGGLRHPAEAKNLKRQGVKSGVADVILLIPKKGYASLCMEFKKEKKKQSKEQLEFQKQVESYGSKYVIVRSVSDAVKIMKWYLK